MSFVGANAANISDGRKFSCGQVVERQQHDSLSTPPADDARETIYRRIKLCCCFSFCDFHGLVSLSQILELPERISQHFAIWICSRNLQLQLKSEHKPIEHIDQWKSNIVTKYVDQESGRDDPPLLFWRRDVVTLLSDEKQVLSCVVFER